MKSANFEFLGRELRQDLTPQELTLLDDACVVFECYRLDSDQVMHWIYTVGGFLNGEKVGNKAGGALVGGQTIIVHAKTRQDADRMAYDGLMTTIEALQRQKVDVTERTGVTSHSEILSTRH